MSLSKQLIENKKSPAPQPVSYPFDGAVYAVDGKYYFGFSMPGMIGNMFPENMWIARGTLFSAEIPKQSKWYLVAVCKFSNNNLTSVNLSVEKEQPQLPEPKKNSIPSTFKVILWVGYGDAYSYKMFNGNIIIKPVLLFRSYKTTAECGTSNYEDYYSIAAIA